MKETSPNIATPDQTAPKKGSQNPEFRLISESFHIWIMLLLYAAWDTIYVALSLKKKQKKQ